MLSALVSPQHDVSMRDRQPYSPNVLTENRLCPGCKQSAVNENGGLVVAFGQSYFHVDCFKCAKCGDQVTADTNLLLLSDGSPICANCSYSCNICRLPILDEAIMTGDDSYHAHCFKCKVCKSRIDELVFAKTSQGIYCMNCHSERMAKVRRHAQKKAERAEREKERAAALAAGNRPPGAQSPSSRPVASPSPSSKGFPPHSEGYSPPTQQSSHVSKSLPSSGLSSPPSFGDAFASTGRTSSPRPTPPTSPFRSHYSPSPQPSPRTNTLEITPHPTPPPRSPIRLASAPQPERKTPDGSPKTPLSDQNHLLSPTRSNSEGPQRRKSFDDGGRTRNLLLPQANGSLDSSDTSDNGLGDVGNLSIPGSWRPGVRKRRSINSALLDLDTKTTPSTSETLVPSPTLIRSQTLDRDSTRTRSPLATQFPDLSPSLLTPRAAPSQGNIRPSPDAADQKPPHVNSDSLGARDAEGSQTVIISGAPPEVPKLDAVPHRPTDLILAPDDGSLDPTRDGEITQSPVRATLSGERAAFAQHQQRAMADGRLSPSASENRLSNPALEVMRSSANRSRPSSPAHKVDVPRGVESGTDTEAEYEAGNKSADSEPGSESLPLPSKGTTSVREGSPLQGAEVSDVEDISPAEERMSHATFIAPALPPIRFSMNGEFAELLTDATPPPPPKHFNQLEKLSEDGDRAASPLHSSETAHERDRNATATSESLSVSMSLRPPGRASSQDGHHGHFMNRSLVIPTEHLTLPKRSNTINPRSPVGRGGLASSLETPRAHEFNEYRARASSDSSNSASQHSHGSSGIVRPGEPANPKQLGRESSTIRRRLMETLSDTAERSQQILVDKSLLEMILNFIDRRSQEHTTLKGELDGMKRASKHIIDGLSVAQTEYDGEMKARRDAEAEITRLRVLLSGQAARLTAMNGENVRQEERQRMLKELDEKLNGLSCGIAALRVERDMALAELEELTAAKSASRQNNTEVTGGQLGRSMTMRLDNIKMQYQKELLPLTQQREALACEIAELKGARDVFLEETTVLNARNEELAKLSALYTRKIDAAGGEIPRPVMSPSPKRSGSFDKSRPLPPQPPQHPLTSMLYAGNHSNPGLSQIDEFSESRSFKVQKTEQELPAKTKFIKWPGTKIKEPVVKEFTLSPNSSVSTFDIGRGRSYKEHAFQHVSLLRFTRCDHCGDKMWGSQLRCSGCSMSVHVRCSNNVNVLCLQQNSRRDDVPMPPSMFGRDLTEQVRADAQGGDRMVPIIVEKCIEAVEVTAMDYEGIYRKTGGSAQSKAITQLFERGDYSAFDLRDFNRFTDICSVTSVLKTYFRSLPVPLLTYDLHESFIQAAEIKDTALKSKSLSDIVKKLPTEHYYTLRILMLHLHHVREQCEKNLMTARNLGVVFGPTLMRSPDPAAEFSDMAGKALSIEWLVENATTIFNPTIPPA